MDELESLSPTKWECKYHVVFIPKCRRKALYQELRGIWGKCSAVWQSEKRVRSKKGICDPIMCT